MMCATGAAEEDLVEAPGDRFALFAGADVFRSPTAHESLGGSGGQHGDEPNPRDHQADADDPPAVRRHGRIAVADGRHGRDRPPNAVPGADVLLDRRERCPAAEDSYQG